MTTPIQISGNIHPYNTTFDTLIDMLYQLDIHAAHSDTNGSVFDDTTGQHARLAIYETIANEPFHILFNDGPIDDDVARQVLYAMTKHRPILMTGAPVFARSLGSFARDLIMAHLRQFHSINLPELELDEMKVLIDTLTDMDYHLTSNEVTLIDAGMRVYFRKSQEVI